MSDQVKAYTELEARTYFSGRYGFEVLNEHGDVLRAFDFHNANPLAAIDDILSVYLASGAQKLLWYFGIINNSPTPSLSTNDTAASHAGWSEFTNYTQATRQAWTPGSVSGQSVTNPTSASFTMDTGGGALYGAFIASSSTKSGTAGILFSTGAFPSVQTLSVGQILRTTFTETGAAA